MAAPVVPVVLVVVLVGLAPGCAVTPYADEPVAPRTAAAPAAPTASPTGAPPSRLPHPTADPDPTSGAAPARGRGPSTAGPGATATGPVVTALAGLRVAGRAPMTGYRRARFGQAWLDADRNGCDTRDDVLRRDLRAIVLDPRTGGCVVLRGVLDDPYTGTEIDFVRGGGASVDVDHVVALGDAWSSGAGRLDVRTRAALANDPLGLLAVDAGANRAKGDANAASWLPPARSGRCAYVARQVAVKAKYALTVTRAEKAAVLRVLATCPDQALPRDLTDAPTRVDQHVTDPGPANGPANGPTSVPGSGSGHGPSGGREARAPYARCADVRAAGAAPLHRGDPGWSDSLDRDHDGTACE